MFLAVARPLGTAGAEGLPRGLGTRFFFWFFLHRHGDGVRVLLGHAGVVPGGADHGASF